MGLRELARAIKKSPSFLVGLETEMGSLRPPSTLRDIATILKLPPDRLITLAGKVPTNAPGGQLEAALFRQMKSYLTKRSEGSSRILQRTARSRNVVWSFRS